MIQRGHIGARINDLERFVFSIDKPASKERGVRICANGKTRNSPGSSYNFMGLDTGKYAGTQVRNNSQNLYPF